MFPIWKDACSPVQPLRTVILDLHGTAVAIDLDMSSLLNYNLHERWDLVKHVDLKVVLDSSTQMSGIQRAGAACSHSMALPWLTLRSTYRLRPHTLERLCRAYGKVETTNRTLRYDTPRKQTARRRVSRGAHEHTPLYFRTLGTHTFARFQQLCLSRPLRCWKHYCHPSPTVCGRWIGDLTPSHIAAPASSL